MRTCLVLVSRWPRLLGRLLNGIVCEPHARICFDNCSRLGVPDEGSMDHGVMIVQLSSALWVVVSFAFLHLGVRVAWMPPRVAWLQCSSLVC